MTLAANDASSDAASSWIRIDSRRRWFPDFRELYRYRQLIFLFGRRDLTVRYRQTALGRIWLFVGPLVSAGLFSFVFGRVAQLSSGDNSYFVFSYAGLVGWNLFSNVLSGASTSMTSSSAIITKIYFPRLVVPIATLASSFLTTAISLGVMAALLAFTGSAVSLQVLLLPIWLLLAVMLALGLSLALTAVSVSYRDVNYLTPLMTQLLLYLSPVAYSLNEVPDSVRELYLLNPLATIIEGCRWSLLGGDALPPAWAIAYTVVVTALVVVGGVVIFSRREPGFADVI